MAKYCVLLQKIFVHPLWSRDPHSSKEKVKTIDIQGISPSRDYDFKDGFFLHCQYWQKLTRNITFRIQSQWHRK